MVFEIVLSCLGGCTVNPSVLITGMPALWQESMETEADAERRCCTTDFEDEERVVSQIIQGDSRPGKGKGEVMP